MHRKIEHTLCTLESIYAYRLSTKAPGRRCGEIGVAAPDFRGSSAAFDFLHAALVTA